jgi:hypothetical protein
MPLATIVPSVSAALARKTGCNPSFLYRLQVNIRLPEALIKELRTGNEVLSSLF